MKGPEGHTFVVDIFRVKGSKKQHAYRVFSELASSDAAHGGLRFKGLTMPDEAPLPQVGASLEREDIFGLRDVRAAGDPPPSWQAIWHERDAAYRLWVLSPADRVEASNGPGQETRADIGRRVRYVDVIREGADLDSTFVAVHEPGLGRDMPIERVERIELPANAGPDAVGLKIKSRWGDYIILSEVASPVTVGGVRFQGVLGIVGRLPGRRQWILSSEASVLKVGNFGFDQRTSAWAGAVKSSSDESFSTDVRRPVDWSSEPSEVTSYVRVKTGELETGLPVRATTQDSIVIDRYPLPAVSEFYLPDAVAMERW